MQQEHRQAKPSRAGSGTGRAALAAAAVMLALTVWGRGPALALAGALVGPLPALRTALEWGRQAAGEAPDAESAGEAPASSTAPAPALDPTAIERYLVPLLTDADKPAGAGAVTETSYGQGSGEKYIACAAGTIKNNTSVSAAEVAAEVQNPLPFSIELNSPDPQVLIMHTHATECYRPAEGLWFLPGDGARTTDRAANMCAVGAVMADTLNAAGIHTLHDETLNDYPSYTGSYSNSRAVVQQYLAQYPSIKVVLDVHRDAIEKEDGTRVAPVAEVNGRKAAQVMLICGCDNGSTVSLPNWRQNLRFAAAWEGAMEGMYPGFTRPVLFSYRFYNQDLTTGSLLIEIGTHGNNLNEALYAGQLAANALASLFTEAG